jgi:hypothetical protein
MNDPMKLKVRKTEYGWLASLTRPSWQIDVLVGYYPNQQECLQYGSLAYKFSQTNLQGILR